MFGVKVTAASCVGTYDTITVLQQNGLR